MRIKCRAYFPENADTQFGFYGLPGEAHRRIKSGEEFLFEYDESRHAINEIDGLKIIGSWVEVLEMPKRKTKSKDELVA